ncbi:hypothetical protein POM88_015056 [Heracleum sosnowskyi]|uniref:DUF7887 domain-containing protein n=1 Tax=Heracleum sosnowskyi TaxID=360622 RepID=A0AAD8ILJ4_9APIA|nr:hypothetical protein POM88_015056 [Heracleum sosnowskyi]
MIPWMQDCVANKMLLTGKNFIIFTSISSHLCTNNDARKFARVITSAKKEESSGETTDKLAAFPVRVPKRLLAQSVVAILGLGFVDAGYSGDWSRIGAISKETEDLLKLGAFVIQFGKSVRKVHYQLQEIVQNNRALNIFSSFCFVEANFKDSMPKKEHFSKALYTIDIGQNDFGMGLFTNKSIKEVKASVPDTIVGLRTHIRSIYSLGARTFCIHNTGPIGYRAGCSIPHNAISKYYNYKLKEAIHQLRKELPSAAITLVDIYSVKYSIYKEAERLGFKEPLKACCGYGGKYNYGDNLTCSGIQTRTTNIYRGAFSDPRNTPPSMACHKFSS